MKREPEEKKFVWEDGELFYRHWKPAEDSDRILFLFHRGHEHSGRMMEMVEALDLPDTHIVAWDARGHGQSPGRRGFAPNGFANLVTDMDAFVRGVCEELNLPLSNACVVAHSVAAVVASCWIHDLNPGIRALVLATPAFRVRLYVPFALPGLRLLNKIHPTAKISSYVKGKLLTHDTEQARSYDADESISKDISNRVLVEMASAAERVVEDAHTIATPILMLQASSDWVVDNSVQDRFFANLGSRCKQRHDIPGSYHAVFHETSRGHTLGVIRTFLTERWSLPAQKGVEPLITAVNVAHAERLAKKLSILNPKRWAFLFTRLSMRFPGSLSKGIAIGWKHGFDSGSSLDHVYRNESAGITPIGKLIDRVYLDSVGWRGIRKRAENMQQALTTAASLQPEDEVKVVDIASGPGRYLLDFVRGYEGKISAIGRDRDEQGLQEGRELAKATNCEAIRYESGDAFDTDDLTKLFGSVNVAIASGVYELFADNEMIQRSIRGIHRALPEGGCFIYTNQPWHPQLEFIARVLPNRDGAPWVMRCRPQAEIDALVAEVGFEKIRTWSDQWGIFTVSIARRTT